MVVDTEEEFDWSAPFGRDSVATTSIAAQFLAHDQAFDRLGVVPAYVVDWPVATTDSAARSLRALLESGRCEIGAHLQPWVNPPFTEDISTPNSYAGNLPAALERDKLVRLSAAIGEAFGVRPTIYKAGRYGLGPNTTAILVELGFEVDTSVTPFTGFDDDGGPDFSRFGFQPFWFGPSERPILELPTTTGLCGALRRLGGAAAPLFRPAAVRWHLPGFAARIGAIERIRLSPEGNSLAELIRVTRALFADGLRVFTLSYHSPSLAPGHTPYVRDPDDLRAFVATIRDYLRFFKDEMGGEFRRVSEVRDRLARQTGV